METIKYWTACVGFAAAMVFFLYCLFFIAVYALMMGIGVFMALTFGYVWMTVKYDDTKHWDDYLDKE